MIIARTMYGQTEQLLEGQTVELNKIMNEMKGGHEEMKARQ